MPIKRPVRRRRKPATARWWAGRRLTAYGREALSVLVLVGTLFLRDQPGLPVAKREEDRPPDVWAVDLRGPEAWWGLSASARVMPPRPFPEQKRPPCMPGGEAEVNGGCWIPHRADAPCPSNTFEHGGRCYLPVRVSERPPTSLGK